jgi:hypothetical protein
MSLPKPPVDHTRKMMRVRGPTYNLILEMSVGNPLLTPEQIAALVGRNSTVVRTVMRSDEFLEHRARLLLERYGDKMENVRHKILDLADTMLDALQRRIVENESSDATPQNLLDAVKWLMPFVTAPVADPNMKQQPPAHPTVNIFHVPQSDLEHARQAQLERSRTISLPIHPSTAPAPPGPGLRQSTVAKEREDI